MCSRCDEILEEKKLAPLGHEIIVQKPVEPTCISNGYTYGEYCTRCDYSIKQEIVDPLGHTLETVVIEPTCEKEGYTIFTCYCGLSYVDLYINLDENGKEILIFCAHTTCIFMILLL